MKVYDCICVGAGASGYFAAIQAAKKGSNSVLILEKSNKVLSKVRISGGGRCNVTHNADNSKQIAAQYPRGGRKLKKGFGEFNYSSTMEWFTKAGVQLKTEADGRVFPVSNSSDTIINALESEAKGNAVKIKLSEEVKEIKRINGLFEIQTKNSVYKAKFVILATGGHPKSSFYELVQSLGLRVSPPIPSLFTFNVPGSPAKHLQGLSVNQATVRIPGTKWSQQGPLLITHWGFSAPSVILLSAWAALDLHQRQYQFPMAINWINHPENEAREVVQDFANQHRLKLVKNQNPFGLPNRLWLYLLQRATIDEKQQWHDLGKKLLNKLINHLVNDDYQVNGKTTFKEEFVTCGGIELSELNLKDFSCKNIDGLYAIGELVNVDGITGGYNFQHAWTSGYLAGKSVANKLLEN